MSMVTRTLPLAGILLFFIVSVVWRSWLQYRRHGHGGIVLFRAGDRGRRMRELLFALLFLVIIVQAAAFAATGTLSGIYVIAPLTNAGWVAIGGILLFGGIAFLSMAQLQMGASWRIGIDEGARPGLVTGGVYRFSRNPIYLGILLFLTGLTVLLPTWISAVVLLSTFIGVRRQVLEEEDYLLRTYRDDYRAYARRVGRFLPGVGGLR